MKSSSNNKKTKKLSLTVGICTCYGDSSILETVKSVRNSQGIEKFKFIIVADRTPISKEIKRELKKFNVQLIENKKEASQIDKQKQILAITKTDILILTQDDVLLHPNTLRKVIEKFTKNPEITMISIPYLPVKATNFFEALLNVGTDIANKTAHYWNNGENYLSSIGRFMAFRTNTINKFRMPSLAVTDNYYYFENKKFGGKFGYIPDVAVYFKNPQNMKEHLRKSSRFQHSKKEMSHYFGDLEKEYSIPKTAIARAVVQEFIKNPLYTLLYTAIFIYSRLLKLKPDQVLNPIWEIDLSTKNIF